MHVRQVLGVPSQVTHGLMQSVHVKSSVSTFPDSHSDRHLSSKK